MSDFGSGPHVAMVYEKWNALGKLLGAYLHQDWLDEFSDDAVALQAILQSQPREQIAAGVEEIDALLAARLPEADLRTILVDQVGCYFDPGSKGLTYEEWLYGVRSTFVG